MSENMKGKAKDLTKGAPRSPHERLGGFVILARAIDKCRATINGSVGEYEFNCPLDNMLFGWKGIIGADVRKFVETDATDAEIADWVKKSGTLKSENEVKAWSDVTEKEDYSGNLENKKWLESQNKRLGLLKDGTLFDYLDADDKTSFLSTKSVCPII